MSKNDSPMAFAMTDDNFVHISSQPIKKYKSDRFCECGKKLSMYNPLKRCYACSHTKTMKDVLSVTGRRSMQSSTGYISKKIGK